MFLNKLGILHYGFYWLHLSQWLTLEHAEIIVSHDCRGSIGMSQPNLPIEIRNKHDSLLTICPRCNVDIVPIGIDPNSVELGLDKILSSVLSDKPTMLEAATFKIDLYPYIKKATL